MIFSEIYSAYYNAMACLINAAIERNLNDKNIYDYINNCAFKESFVYITEAIKKEQWNIITKEYNTPIRHYAKMPLTILQRRFLKTIMLDKRFKLFCDKEFDELKDVEPLYTEEDFFFFDIIKDGDPFCDPDYIKIFRTVLQALKEKKQISVVYEGGNGKRISGNFTPGILEYSEKDDKFRLVCPGKHKETTINIARIKECKILNITYTDKKTYRKKDSITFIITDERNAMERCMLHFANYEKSTRKIDNKQYEMNLIYNKEAETEILIRVLSFGPLLKVTSPESFINQIKNRLQLQRKYSSQLF